MPLVVALLLLFCAAVDAVQLTVPVPQPGDVTELDPIVVVPLRPYYAYEGQRQLNRLRSTLPEMGDESPVSGVIAQLRNFYEARKDPNSLGPFQQEMLLRALGERDIP